MAPMSDTEIFVTWKEYAKSQEDMNNRFTTSMDAMRSLMVTLANNGETASQARHVSLSGKVQTQWERSEERDEKLSQQAADHAKKDDAVAERVLKLEEGQKRMGWVLAVAFPSFIAAWETIRARFLTH